MDFWIVDVFSRGRACTGNPLAVVAYSPERDLTSERMQEIACEFGFSETTFVASAADEDGEWPTRIFTPLTEMAFAGHPTLGTAWVIAQHLSFDKASLVRLKLPAVSVAVDVADAWGLWLTAPSVRRREAPELSALCDQWGLRPEDVDPTFPLATLETGPVYHIVPVRSLEALARLTPPVQAPDHLYAVARVPGEEGSVRVRMFAPYAGVPEDPATGSAAVCLGAYLLDTDYLGQGLEARVRILQGEEVGRPSLLELSARRDAEGREVIRVGGQVRAFAQGRLTQELVAGLLP